MNNDRILPRISDKNISKPAVDKGPRLSLDQHRSSMNRDIEARNYYNSYYNVTGNKEIANQVMQNIERKQYEQNVESYLEKAIEIVAKDRTKYNIFIKHLLKDVMSTYGVKEVQNYKDKPRTAMQSNLPELQSSSGNFTEEAPIQEQNQDLRESSKPGPEERKKIIRGYLTNINEKSKYPAIAELARKQLEVVLRLCQISPPTSQDISNRITLRPDVSDQQQLERDFETVCAVYKEYYDLAKEDAEDDWGEDTFDSVINKLVLNANFDRTPIRKLRKATSDERYTMAASGPSQKGNFVSELDTYMGELHKATNPIMLGNRGVHLSGVAALKTLQEIHQDWKNPGCNASLDNIRARDTDFANKMQNWFEELEDELGKANVSF